MKRVESISDKAIAVARQGAQNDRLAAESRGGSSAPVAADLDFRDSYAYPDAD